MCERQDSGEGEREPVVYNYASPVGFDRFVKMIELMRELQDLAGAAPSTNSEGGAKKVDLEVEAVTQQ